MSTMTVNGSAPVRSLPGGPRDFTAPGLRSLTRIELRKATNTRSGKALVGLMVAAQAILVLVLALVNDSADLTFENFARGALVPPFFLLVIVGILLVTAEWSQRTAMATFIMVPKRGRIVQAKVLGVLALAGFTFAFGLALSAGAATLVGDGDTWNVTIAGAAQGLLVVSISGLIGVGLGLLLRAPAPAIVSYFVIPALLSVLAGLISSLEDVVKWVDPTQAFSPLNEFAASGADWGRIGTCFALWVVVTIALGTRRVLRSEIK